MTATHDSTHDTPTRAHSAVMCVRFETGYELHPIQQQAAQVTRSRWRDAIVTAVTPDARRDGRAAGVSASDNASA